MLLPQPSNTTSCSCHTQWNKLLEFHWHPTYTTISTTLKVNIEDFIAMVQSNNPTLFRQVSRHLLYAIDNKFPAPISQEVQWAQQ